MNEVILTPALIHAGRTGSGGWNKRQLEALGIPKLKTGWIESNSGRVVTKEQYELFLSLKGKRK